MTFKVNEVFHSIQGRDGAPSANAERARTDAPVARPIRG